MALSAIDKGYKLNVIGPARKDFYDTIGSMDKLWAYKEFGLILPIARGVGIDEMPDSPRPSLGNPVRPGPPGGRGPCRCLQYPLHRRPQDPAPKAAIQRPPRRLRHAEDLLQARRPPPAALPAPATLANALVCYR